MPPLPFRATSDRGGQKRKIVNSRQKRGISMCALCEIKTAGKGTLAGRRSFLKLAGAAVAGLATSGTGFAAPPKAPPKPENVLSPDAALDRLMRGNHRYVEGVSKRHDFKHEREALSAGQNPYAG